MRLIDTPGREKARTVARRTPDEAPVTTITLELPKAGRLGALFGRLVGKVQEVGDAEDDERRRCETRRAGPSEERDETARRNPGAEAVGARQQLADREPKTTAWPLARFRDRRFLADRA